MPYIRRTGFTLIELIIVIVISSILAMVAINSYITVRQKQQLTDETIKIQNILNTAQSKAIAAASDANGDPVQWGVYIDNNTPENATYHIAPIPGDDPRAFDINALPNGTQDYTLSGNIQFKNPLYHPPNTKRLLITFDKLTGAVTPHKCNPGICNDINNPNPITITLQNHQFEQTLTITLNGQIETSTVQRI